MLAVCILALHVGQVGAREGRDRCPAPDDASGYRGGCGALATSAAAPIIERGTGDAAVRRRAWDETAFLPVVDILINTTEVVPADVAVAIRSRVQDWHSSALGPFRVPR
jgi:hypothetical protein